MLVPDWILHVDLDQFLAAVEMRRRPELVGRPVVIGGSGDPTEPRTVVMCASYPARAHGVRAGMPLRAAARRCPEAVFLPPDAAAYERASGQVMDVLRSLAVAVEVWGWDEAFLGARTSDPEALARDVQRAVTAGTGLSCSVGIGDSKQRAKLATGFAKPAGVFRLTAENWVELMADRPTEALWGVGRKTAAALTALGVGTVGELAAADPTILAARFGPNSGPRLAEIASGGGDAELVTTPRVRRSRSRQTTFARNLTDRAEIAARLGALTRETAAEVDAAGRSVHRVAVTVRAAPFFTSTRAAALPAPTRDAAVIERTALALLERFDPGRPVRLIGVRLDLTAAGPGSDPAR